LTGVKKKGRLVALSSRCCLEHDLCQASKESKTRNNIINLVRKLQKLDAIFSNGWIRKRREAVITKAWPQQMGLFCLG